MNREKKKLEYWGRKALTMLLCMVVGISSVQWPSFAVFAEAAESTEITANAVAHASSEWQSAAYAIDGDANTRWETVSEDPQWICLDFDQTYRFDKVVISWEVAAGKVYDIQVSDDEENWTTVYTVTDGGEGETEEMVLPDNVTGQYLRMYGTERATGYGYSIWEMDVYGEAVGSSSSGDDGDEKALEISGFTTSVSSVSAVGESITLTCTATGGTGNLQYTFYGDDAGLGTEFVIYEGTANTAVYTATEAGTWSFFVVVTDEAGNTANAFTSHIWAEANDLPYLLSEGRPAYASTTESGDVATRMTDGNYATSWKSVNGTIGTDRTAEQWFDVDLGAVATITKVVIDWTANNTYSTDFDIQVSDDELNWTTVYSVQGSDGGEMVTHNFADGNSDTYPQITIDGLGATGRYVRVYSHASQGNNPIQVREFNVYGMNGKNPRPVEVNDLAAGAAVLASSTSVPWWASSPDQLSAEKAVDGNYDSYWLSDSSADYNDAWFQVDLGAVYKIGKVTIQWQVEFGRVYELQTSGDGTNWKTVYRQTYGYGEDEVILLCEEARYVRMQGIAMGRGSGYSLREFHVYEWQEGDLTQTPALDTLTEMEIIQAGSGSYVTGDYTMSQPRYPAYHTGNVQVPIPSNDWWTSLLYTRLSDGMPSLPYRVNYTEIGLGLYYASDLFTSPNNGGMDSKDENDDLTINSSSITGKTAAKVDGYGDWSVNVAYGDEEGEAKMMTTIVKGSPYLYNTFADPSSAEVAVTGLMGFYDINGNAVLTEDSQSVTTDFLGITTKYKVTSPEVNQQYKYHQYGLFMPEGTQITRLGSKLKIRLGSGANYLVVGVIPSTDKYDVSGYDLNAVRTLYAHAYAYITDTEVAYVYDERLATITTNYVITTEAKRAGFSDQTLTGLLPTHWKYATNATEQLLAGSTVTYSSPRGLIKTIPANAYTISDVFNGIIPVFDEPIESASYDREAMLEYLDMFVESVKKDYWVADPYWQGKKNHPLAMGIIIADQLGETEIRDDLIVILRKILENWLTYDGADDYPYYMYYSDSWGTVNGDGGDHGMAMNLSDHHFLWAYFIFPAAVLASYDQQFMDEYGEMVELLIRDCMNPSKDDELFPWMRNFDPYEGHSWAGGYGDNQSGNNQESTSEATFAWAGLYLWGLVTGNDTYRDAGIWGYTQEVNAIEQYWFDYDGDNWDSAYTSGVVGMLWGSSYTNGTYFSGNPSCIYGIHMLPVTGALTYLGSDREANQAVWAAYEADQYAYQMKLKARTEDPNDEFYGHDYTTIDPEGWFHILWPYQALGDVDTVLERLDVNEFPNDELFNSYWFIMNMDAKGYMATDVWASNWTAYEIFMTEDGTYHATVWNPTDETIYVEFANASGKTGSAYISAHATTTVNPFADTPAAETDKDYVQPDIDNQVISLPNLLQAEDYYTNFSCSVWNDATEGDYIGSISAGSMLLYSVDVAAEKDYNLGIRTMNYSGGSVTMEISSAETGEVLCTAVIPATENSAWSTYTTTIHLAAGVQQLKVKFLGGNINFNWLDVYEIGSTPNYDKYDPTVEDPYVNIAYGKDVTVSSEVGGNTGSAAVDEDTTTRWESLFEDPQYLVVDLGSVSVVQGFKIVWENAAGKAYTVDISEDGTSWTAIGEKTDGSGGHTYKTILDETVRARYVRIYGTERTGGYGYSIYEFYVYGDQLKEDNPGENDPEETTPEETTPENTLTPEEMAATQVIGVTAAYVNGSVIINWNDCGADGYMVARSDGRSGYTYLTYRATAAGWTDSNVIKGQLYYYRVIPYFYASDGSTISGVLSDAAGVLAADKVPDQVTGVTAQVSGSTVVLNWDRADSARYYKISRAAGSTGKYYTVKYNITETAYTDSGLSAGTYRYKVVGYYKNLDGSWTYGDLCDTLYVTVK